jgi:hypothetical protein
MHFRDHREGAVVVALPASDKHSADFYNRIFLRMFPSAAMHFGGHEYAEIGLGVGGKTPPWQFISF